MRVFVGISIKEDLGKKMEEWQKEFQISNAKFQIKSKIPNSNIRFIKSKNLHITLMPPWEAEKEQVQLVCRSLDEVYLERSREARDDIRPFEIKFNTVEFGPNQYQPRLIWASGDAPKELIVLIDDIKQVLSSVTSPRPSPKSEREYRLHCTLARMKLNSPLPPLVSRGGEKVDWQMQADRFVLYESHLSPAGAEYEILEEFKL